jgi:hypothetical protein
MDMTTTRITTIMNTPATTASSRSLKIRRAPRAAPIVPEAICDRTWSTWERNPSLGSAEKIFWYPAVSVTISSQTSGTTVTQA